MAAQEHAQQAVSMEPSNMEYRQFLQNLQFGGTLVSEYGFQLSETGIGIVKNVCNLVWFYDVFELLLFSTVLRYVVKR